MTRCESLTVDDEASKGMSGWMKCLLTPWQSRSGVVLEPTVVIDIVVSRRKRGRSQGRSTSRGCDALGCKFETGKLEIIGIIEHDGIERLFSSTTKFKYKSMSAFGSNHPNLMLWFFPEDIQP